MKGHNTLDTPRAPSIDSSQRSDANCGAMSRAANSRNAAWQPTICRRRRPLTSAELLQKNTETSRTYPVRGLAEAGLVIGLQQRWCRVSLIVLR